MSKNLQDKQKEIIFFDNLVAENVNYISLSEESYKNFFLILKKNIETSSNFLNLKILEIGCGTGAFTKELLKIKNSEIFATDISGESIKIIKKKHPNIHSSIQDAENLSYDNSYFDIVVLSGVLHHFMDLNKVLSESFRVLKKNGVFFSYDPHLCNPFFWLFRRKSSLFYMKNGVTQNEEPLTEKKIVEATNNFNLEKIKIIKKSNFSYKKIHNSILNSFIPIYNFIDRLISIIGLEKIIGSFLITIIKK